MKKVRGAIEKEIGEPVRSIAPAFPRLSTYFWNEIRSALAHAGLLSSRRRNAIPVYEEANAAYAALGHGLCDPTMNYTGCAEYRKSQKAQTVLYVSFDNSSISVGVMELKNAFDDRATFSYGTNTKLGWWNLPVFEAPRAKFWEQVHEMILAVLQPLARPPNKIILLGEHGADEEFKDVVNAAVWEVFEFDVDLMLGTVQKEDVGYLAARGAAESGFRDEEWMRQSEALRRDQRS